jgi:hypothetical protein
MIHRRSLPDPVLAQGACHREVQHVKSVQALTGQNISVRISHTPRLSLAHCAGYHHDHLSSAMIA